MTFFNAENIYNITCVCQMYFTYNYVTRSDKTSLIAQKHTCSLNLVYLLLHMSQSDSVSFIRIASDLFTSEQNFIWILALQTMIWNFKHVKLGQILMGYKTGFVRPGHILRIINLCPDLAAKNQEYGQIHWLF